MTDNILRVERKRIELEKFRDLVLAAIEYQLQDTSARIKTDDFDDLLRTYEARKSKKRG
jgi:hypothetical protein